MRLSVGVARGAKELPRIQDCYDLCSFLLSYQLLSFLSPSQVDVFLLVSTQREGVFCPCLIERPNSTTARPASSTSHSILE